MDICLLFKSFNRLTLDKLRTKLDLHIDEDKLWELYEEITKKPFQFLYIDVVNCQFRKNFNVLLKLK